MDMISNGSMININLREIAQLRGYKNAKQLADAMSERFGVSISYSTIYPLWANTAELYSRPTLNRLCKFLNVAPGILITYNEDEGQESGTGSQPAAKTPGRKAASKASSKAKMNAARSGR